MSRSRSGRFTRYMLRELLGPTLLGLLLYTFVLLMNHFFLVAEKALSKNLGAELTTRLFLVGIPKLLVMSIPMAVLLGTLIALGRLSADHEWVALQAAGHGLKVVLRPVLLFGLIGSLAGLLIYGILVPRTNYAIRNLRGEVLFSSNLAADVRPRVFYDLPDDAVLFVDDIRAGGERRMENVLLIQPDPGEDLTRLVLAKFGDLYPAPDGSGALVVDLFDGQAHSYRSESPELYRVATFDRYEGLRLEPPNYIRALLNPPEKVAQDLTLRELWADIGQAEQRRRILVEGEGDPNAGGRLLMAERRLAMSRVELNQRFALPMASFFFALLALPLGITGVRSGKGAGFAMSVVVILVYRVIFVLARNQATLGRIPADLGPWVANGVILLWALFALWRLRRGNVPSRGAFGLALPRFLRRKPSKSLSGTAGSGELAPSPEPVGASPGELVALGGTSRRFVARLDRYIGSAYLRLVAFALASAYLIYALVELQELMDSVLRTKQPLSLVLNYFKYFAPGVLPIVLPISCLVGAIVAFTLLTRSSELVAVKAAGVSMRRATLPVLSLTLLMCGLLFLVQDRIAPAATRHAQEIKDEIKKRAPRTHGLPTRGGWGFGQDGNTLYHYRLYNPKEDVFQSLSVFTLDRTTPRVVDHRFSERATWTGKSWRLRNGWYRTFVTRNGSPHEATAGDIESTLELNDGVQDVELDLPRYLARDRSRLSRSSDAADQMSIAELRQEIATLEHSGYDITKLRVAYYGKYSHALSPLVMVLLGLPFAFKIGRRGSLYGIGVALLLVLVYWATFAVFNALGLETLLRPIVAAWAPNVLFGLLGIYLMLYIKT